MEEADAMKEARGIVVKVGGSTWDSRDTALDDLASLQRQGQRLVVPGISTASLAGLGRRRW